MAFSIPLALRLLRLIRARTRAKIQREKTSSSGATQRTLNLRALPVVFTRRVVMRGLALVSSTISVFPSSVGAHTIPSFRRGISVSHLFGWADVRPNGSYANPPFGEARFEPLADQLQSIQAAGFDFIRLAVDPGPFLDTALARGDDLEQRLYATVSAILDRQLGVIVDLHPSRENPAFTPTQLTAGVSTPEFRAVAAFLTRLASRLDKLMSIGGDRSARLALELMNEPEIPPEAWAPMLQAAYRAARRGSPRLPLVIGGGNMNAPEALETMDVATFVSDKNIIYTFHDYQPWQFTHQGLLGNPAYEFDDIPYPAPATADTMLAATDKRIADLSLGLIGASTARLEARRALVKYSRSAYDRSTMSLTFDSVDAWRKAHNLPPQAILVGEFGVHLTPYMRGPQGSASRFRWLRDMRELAEQHGFAWACWTYVAVGGFALADHEVGPGFDEGTIRALGLRLAL